MVGLAAKLKQGMRLMSVARHLFVGLSLSTAANVALADVSGDLDSGDELRPLYIRAGTYLLESLTQARVDGREGNIGSRLNFEDDLNLERRKPTLLAGMRWRFHDRHFLELDYFNLKRFGQSRIDAEIRFGDVVFPIGADVSSSFSTEVTRLGYSYRLIKRPDWGMAVSAGLHVTRLRALLDGLVSDNGGAVRPAREIASVTAPLPVFGVSGARRLNEKWMLAARGQWFFLDVDDFGGEITHAAAFLEYDAFNNFGFGFGYDWFDIDADTTDTFWRGAVDVRFRGPMIFIQAAF
jgi:hypothetical protein